MPQVGWRPAYHAGLGLWAPEAGAGGGEKEARDTGQTQACPAHREAWDTGQTQACPARREARDIGQTQACPARWEPRESCPMGTER